MRDILCGLAIEAMTVASLLYIYAHIGQPRVTWKRFLLILLVCMPTLVLTMPWAMFYPEIAKWLVGHVPIAVGMAVTIVVQFGILLMLPGIAVAHAGDILTRKWGKETEREREEVETGDANSLERK